MARTPNAKFEQIQSLIDEGKTIQEACDVAEVKIDTFKSYLQRKKRKILMLKKNRSSPKETAPALYQKLFIPDDSKEELTFQIKGRPKDLAELLARLGGKNGW